MNKEKIASILLLKSNKHDSRAGFTLVEILLVVAILGMLAGVAVVSFKGKTKGAAIQTTRTSIKAVQTAIDTYEVQNGIYPQTLQNLLTKGNETQWTGPYLQGGRLPQDAWGTELAYSLKGESFELRSAGPDRQSGNEDDLTN